MQVIYEEVARRLNLKLHDVSGAVEHSFQATKDAMQSSEEPVILLNHFGSFRMSKYSLDYYIRALIVKAKTEKGLTDKPYTTKLAKYWKLRQKLKKYKHVS